MSGRELNTFLSHSGYAYGHCISLPNLLGKREGKAILCIKEIYTTPSPLYLKTTLFFALKLYHLEQQKNKMSKCSGKPWLSEELAADT